MTSSIFHVVEEEERRCPAGLCNDLLDLCGGGIGCDDVIGGCRDLHGNAATCLDCEDLGVVGEGGDQDRISLLHVRVCDRLEPPAGTGNDPCDVHADELREFPVEPVDGRLFDVVQPVGLPAVVAHGVPVAVRDQGLHRRGGEAAPCLDGVDVDALLLDGADLDIAGTLHGKSSRFSTPTCFSSPAMRDSTSSLSPGPSLWCGAVLRRMTRMSERMNIASKRATIAALDTKSPY